MLSAANGRFSGYASIFGEPDQGGDIVMPGAFAKSLSQKGKGEICLLFQHDPKEPVGNVLKIEEDQTGLKIVGQLFEQVPRANSLIALIEGGAVSGLSIGFRTVKAAKDRHSGHRRLFQIDLWEISIVTFPMMQRARIFPVSKLPEETIRSPGSPQQTIAAAISLMSNQ